MANHLTFSSAEPFTIAVNNAKKNWDGTLYYSTDSATWSEWDGKTAIASAEHDGEQRIYMRGVDNSIIGNNELSSSYYGNWLITGVSVRCDGNIENLLDYETVKNGDHPTMADYCYRYLFKGCTSLVTPPELPATTLNAYCYSNMFNGCTSLVTPPELPATTLTGSCYSGMFGGCTSLTKAPELPATTLATFCYDHMFRGCTSLTTAPELPATTLVTYCYASMFLDCTSLTTAPELPATTLAKYCYNFMFNGCTSLTTAPELPATTLADSCYYCMFDSCTSLTTPPELPATTLERQCYGYMFDDCTSLTKAPELPATTLAPSCYVGMLSGCTSLTTAPELPATTLASYCYYDMFEGCTSLTTPPELPATTLASYCYRGMFNGCTSIKLSASQDDEYTKPYRIPTTGEGTTASGALMDMFVNTSGTFTGTPEINTTYYMFVAEEPEPEEPDIPDIPDEPGSDYRTNIMGLITDRTSRNVVRRNELAAKGWERMTEAERAEWRGDPLATDGVNLLPLGPYYSSTVNITHKNAEFRATATSGGTYLYAVSIIGNAANYENKQFTLSVDKMVSTVGCSPRLALYWHDENGYEYAGATLTQYGSVTVNLANYPNTNGRASLALYVYVTTDTEVEAGAYARFVGVMFENGATRHEYVPYTEIVPTLTTKGAYNYSDLNRVERAVKEISDTRRLGLTTKTDWTMWDIPRKSDMKRYLDNIKTIAFVIGSDIELPDSMDKLTYEGANNIEKVLVEFYE